MPTVSVVIPTFNRATLVVEALRSVLCQTFRDYEIVVIDDGSTDSTRDVLAPSVEDGKVRYVFQPNQGESAARNRGIRMARGKYITFLDSDDLYLPHKLERQVAYLDTHPEVALVHSGYSKFDDAGADLGYRDTSRLSGRIYPRILLEWSVLMAVPTVMVRASVLAEVGGFDEAMRQAPDLDLWRRIAMRYPIAAIPEELCKVRQHAGSVSADKTSAARVFRKYLRKAFDEDPNLTATLRRRARSRMHLNVARTLLGEGSREEMRMVRNECVRSARKWPFHPGPYATLAASFLPRRVREWLARRWRRSRFKPFAKGRGPSPVLLVGSKIAVGGAQRILLTQAEWFRDRGHPVVAAFFYDEERLHSRFQSEVSSPVIDLEAWRRGAGPVSNLFRLVRGMTRLFLLMARGRFTVVETFTHHSNLLGLPLAWLARVPARIATHHGRPAMPRVLDRLHAIVVNSGVVSCLVTVSRQSSRDATEREGVDPGRVVVIRNGIRQQDEVPAPRRDADVVRRELRVEATSTLVLSVGRLVDAKGHVHLLEAVPAVLDRFPEAVFLVVGDGPLRPSLEERASRLGIGAAVRFEGIRFDVDQLLRASDIFVLPSLREGLPLALLDAMAAGTAVVATAVGGIREILVNEQNGLVVPPADASLLSRALLRLLADEALRKRCGDAARELMAQEYTIDRMCEDYSDVFRRMAGRRWRPADSVTRLGPGSPPAAAGPDIGTRSPPSRTSP
jgi:glycosyltransferase involved in cell wall biosynthesis/GT2 family glycosyltransferase